MIRVIYDLKELNPSNANFGFIVSRSTEFDEFDEAIQFARNLQIQHTTFKIVGVPVIEMR